MDRRYRRTIIAGNWKMNETPSQAQALVAKLAPLAGVKYSSVVLCVPSIDIVPVGKALKASKISLGAQNCNAAPSGAFTGEISCDMLRDAGVKYVICGHSERRQMFGETDAVVAEKLRAVLAAGMRPILCVGETDAQHRQGITNELLRMQIKTAFSGISVDDARRVVVAYEPIWAIGTGNTATPEQANDACENIRACLRELYGARNSRAISILYGGSMNEKNAAALMAQVHIDGGLIGGASLKADSFISIVEASK